MLYGVLMFLGWFLFEILSLSAPSSLRQPASDKGHFGGNITRLMNMDISGFHPVSSEPSFPNTICKDLYRMAKMKRILSTVAVLSLHLTGLLGIPDKKNFRNW